MKLIEKTQFHNEMEKNFKVQKYVKSKNNIAVKILSK